MPSGARIIIPHIAHHITQRGCRKGRVFFNDDDYQLYLNLVFSKSSKYEVQILAYCLMPNHVHFIAIPSDEQGLSKVFGQVSKFYSERINERTKKTGTLWQGRYRSYFMDENHLYAAIRYVELNPVKARLCEQAHEYPWSSAKSHVEKTFNALLADSHLLPNISNWKEYLQEKHKVSENLFQSHFASGLPIGDDAFIKKAQLSLQKKLLRKKPGKKRFYQFYTNSVPV